MENNRRYDNDIIDDDLYEEFDDEELLELVQKAKQEALERARIKEQQDIPKRKIPKWPFWLIAFLLVFQVLALLPQTFSIPAIDFLITSARLSVHDDIKEYKKAVVTVETEDGKGTGFGITADGEVLTNYHVVEGEKEVTVAFREEGLFKAEVLHEFPEVDLALLKVQKGKDLPYLELADGLDFTAGEKVHFIGNPLKFNGVANEGTLIDYTGLADWKEDVVMMKAPVYRGNSGSPVINEEGKVIGVVFATMENKTYGKVGLFIPIDYYYERVLQ